MSRSPNTRPGTSNDDPRTTRATILHNPRCSKSRQALALLEDRGIDLTVRRYLDVPLSTAEIERLLDALDLEPRAILRRSEPEYGDNGLDDPALSRSQIVEAVARHPKLLERPIVMTTKGARIGRPPERVLEVL